MFSVSNKETLVRTRKMEISGMDMIRKMAGLNVPGFSNRYLENKLPATFPGLHFQVLVMYGIM